MSDVTRILSAIEQGDGKAAEQLLPLVYDNGASLQRQNGPRKAWSDAAGDSTGPRGVHPVGRLGWAAGMGQPGPLLCCCSRGDAADSANRARDMGRMKRGSGRQRIDLDSVQVVHGYSR